MKLIETIQSRIENIYGIKIGVDANDFVIGEDELYKLMPAQQNTTVPKELFLVSPDLANDTIEVALYLDETLKKNLENNNPLDTLSSENIGDFCSLIEGISHFICYLHKAEIQHNVTQLELELQAEIDKFLLLALLTYSDDTNSFQLLDLLFEDYYLHSNLSTSQEERYETANTLAKKFCYELSKDIKQNKMKELLVKLRSFYPLSQEDKIRSIVT